jgi:prepilin-type N-terminal cleavage/methylation domain-containing protein
MMLPELSLHVRRCRARAGLGRAASGPMSGFTLTELLVVITIIAMLGALTLSGMNVAQRRARIAKTETTIRKIHEVIMPHYERFLTRIPPNLSGLTNTSAERNRRLLISKRWIQTLEMPDGWTDLLVAQDGWQDLISAGIIPNVGDYNTATSRRLRGHAFRALTQGSLGGPKGSLANSDAECLWLSVMRGGFGDPGIIAHFREDEMGDTNGNGQREFIDGWGRPIRFLRWAPGFVSKYQPPLDLTAPDTLSHDAFDPAGVDPFALNTLFPLIFSAGPDGEIGIRHRDGDGEIPLSPHSLQLPPDQAYFSYAAVRFDPYFVARTFHVSRMPEFNTSPFSFLPNRKRAYEPIDAQKWPNSKTTVLQAFQDASVLSFGAPLFNHTDDITNHSMSR